MPFMKINKIIRANYKMHIMSFLRYLTKFIVLFEFNLFSIKKTFIFFFFVKSFDIFILCLKRKKLDFLSGLFFVIAQRTFFLIFSFFRQILDIFKCPICGGSKVPPRTPILFYDILLWSYNAFSCYNIFIRR